MVFVAALLSSSSIVFAFLARIGAARSLRRSALAMIRSRSAFDACGVRDGHLALEARRGSDISLVLIRKKMSRKRQCERVRLIFREPLGGRERERNSNVNKATSALKCGSLFTQMKYEPSRVHAENARSEKVN